MLNLEKKSDAFAQGTIGLTTIPVMVMNLGMTSRLEGKPVLPMLVLIAGIVAFTLLVFKQKKGESKRQWLVRMTSPKFLFIQCCPLAMSVLAWSSLRGIKWNDGEYTFVIFWILIQLLVVLYGVRLGYWIRFAEGQKSNQVQ